MAGEFGPLVIDWTPAVASDLSDAAAVWVAQNTTPDQDWAEAARFPTETELDVISVAEVAARFYCAGVRDAAFHAENQARLRGV